MGALFSALFSTLFSQKQKSLTDYSDDNISCSDEEEEIGDSFRDDYNQIDSNDRFFMDSVTDACVGSLTPVMTISLNLNQVASIESKLDQYEKVSLAFLLYDDPQLALEELNSNLEQVLYNWASKQTLKWQEKLIEALCIIQNYKVLKEIGYQRKILEDRFLPSNIYVFPYVSKYRKLLYYVCESFTKEEADKFVNLANSDFKMKNLDFKIFDILYLELYFLHWECIGYIKSDNFNNLYSILKQMDHLELCDQLKDVIPVQIQNTQRNEKEIKNERSIKNKTVDASTSRNEFIKKPPAIIEDILNCKSGLLDIIQKQSQSHESLESNTVTDDDGNDRYDIDPNNPGICLIINQEYFYTEIDPDCKHLLPPPEKKLEPRKGSDKDKKDLEAIFNRFGFDTHVADNLTHIEIKKKITDIVESVTEESSLFICLMSHGAEGIVYGVNSCAVYVKDIQNIMCKKNYRNLNGKPKILILQSCQGNKCQQILQIDDQEDVETDGPSGNQASPATADMFTFWATVPGYSAIRHKTQGSWFIQSLCEKMEHLAKKKHFEEICTAIVDDVSSKKWRQKHGVEFAMVPLKASTLRKSFFLPPIRNPLAKS